MKLTLKSALVAAIALISVPAFASNMGFKLVYPVYAFNAGVTDGTNIVSIPFFTSYASRTAALVCGDLTVNTIVARWNQATASQQRCKCNATLNGCTGIGTSVNFTFTEGESLIASTPAQFNWTVVGSHDNATPVTLYAFNAGVTDGTNFVAVPYHTNRANAAGLAAEFAPNTILARWNQATASQQRCKVNATQNGCTGIGTSTNFSVTIGEGLIITVPAQANWTPTHF
jgi:hypothetical protein